MIRSWTHDPRIADASVLVIKQATLSGRLDAVDLLRGVVMVLMALDHTRGFFSSPSMDPTDLEKTNTALFLTRWVTHFCAPVFVFLAGTGAFLSGSPGKSKGELAAFLLTRGLWIILLELTIVLCLGWAWNFQYRFVLGGVLWAIGWSMVVLAGLVVLPTSVVTVFGLTLIAFHNLFDNVAANDLGRYRWLWAILHTGDVVQPLRDAPYLPSFWEPLREMLFLPVYPLVPWIGVMAAGYGFGALLLLDPRKRRQELLGLGIALTIAFVTLRAANRYGDPRPWTLQKDGWFTFLSFLNCHKYPPSLLFLLMTLGPAIAALALFDRKPGPLGRVFVTFGRVPLFYYLLHLPLIHAAAAGFAYLRYGPGVLEWTQVPEGYGYSLPVVYLVWLGVVLTLYLPCRWFAGVKQRQRGAWLSYL
jgi:uncharacterized membrane protein